MFVFAVLLLTWPKGAAVAVAAFREGVRQPMFWLLTFAAALLMFVSTLVPYFTMATGEELKMVKELGYDMAAHRSKGPDALPDAFDVAVTMGCGDSCPNLRAKKRTRFHPFGGGSAGRSRCRRGRTLRAAARNIRTGWCRYRW